MFPTERGHLFKGFSSYCSYIIVLARSQLLFLLMANEESNYSREHREKKDQERDKDNWLQLSIGGLRQDLSTNRTSRKANSTLVELSLTPSNYDFRANHSWSLFPSLNEEKEAVNWGFGHRVPISIASSSTSTSSSFSYPFKLYYGVDFSQRQAIDFRVVQSPKRQNVGLWFMLQAMKNQEKEPYLPQVPKSYLRIKDGKTTTIGLVMKYLAKKLNLENESEIEIICKGQRVQPMMTLQHVRDSIWSNKDFITSLRNTSANDCLMVLHYGRSA